MLILRKMMELKKHKKQKPKRRFWLIFPTIVIIAVVGYGLLTYIFTDRLPITAISFSTDNNRFMSVCEDGYLQTWDVKRGKNINREKIPSDWGTTNALAWHPDNQFMALARTYPTKDNEIQFFNSHDLRKTSSISAGSDLIAALCIDPDGNTLYSVTHRLGIGVWDIEKGERLGGLKDLPHRYVSGAMFDRHCQRIATIEGTTSKKYGFDTTDEKIAVYQRINMETLLEVPFSDDLSELPDRIGIRPDGKIAITIKSHDQKLKTINIDTGETKEATLTNLVDPRSLAMGGDEYMAIGGWDGLINIYDGDGILLQTLRPGSSIGTTLQALLD